MASHLRLAPTPCDGGLSPAAPSPIRVVLTDDHEPMRSSLRRVLDGEEHVEVVGEAADLESVEREVRVRRPHVLVLDLGMLNGSTGIAQIGKLRALAPHTRIVGLTMKDDPAFAQYALEAGAMGFVSKEMADTDLGLAIRAAMRGERFVTERVASRLDARRHTSAQGQR